jgi:hypothetical protein
MRCPRCRSGNVHSSRRQGIWERVGLSLMGRRPYRCYDCGRRFIARQHGSWPGVGRILGLHAEQRQNLERLLVEWLVFVALVAASIYLVFYFSHPSAPLSINQ